MQLLTSLSIVALDQLLKFLLSDQAVFNQGLGFGLFADANPDVLLVGQAVAAGYMVWLALKPDQRFARRLGWSFVLGGLGSNLIDRVRLEAVIDVLSFGSWFATFNLADVSVVLGLLLVVFSDHLPPVHLSTSATSVPKSMRQSKDPSRSLAD